MGATTATPDGPRGDAPAAEYRLGEDGWLVNARRVVSPNFDLRPAGARIELLVIHCISLPPGEFAGDGIERLFTNRLDPAAHPFYAGLRDLRVSAHFLVRRDGELLQFVACTDRAWHAGASTFEGRPACNDFSLGVELEGSEFEPFTPGQYAVAGDLARALFGTYPLRAVRGHSDIAAGRKSDPGPLFDWPRLLRAAGLDPDLGPRR